MKILRYFSLPLALSFLLPVLAEAAILEMKPGEAVIEEVKIAKSAILKTPEGKPLELKPYLKGLRKKKVALFWADVYVGQILTAEALPPPKTIEEAFNALSKQPTVAISMTFLRDVYSSQLRSAFADGFEKNGINPETDPTIKPLFEVLKKGGQMFDGETMTIVLQRTKEGAEKLLFENGKGDLQTLDLEKGGASKMLLLWVGKPADSGMETLHNQFLGKEE